MQTVRRKKRGIKKALATTTPIMRKRLHYKKKRITHARQKIRIKSVHQLVAFIITIIDY